MHATFVTLTYSPGFCVQEGYALRDKLCAAGVPVTFVAKDFVPHVFPVMCEVGVPEAAEVRSCRCSMLMGTDLH